MSAPARTLTDADLDAIAERVAQLLRAPRRAAPQPAPAHVADDQLTERRRAQIAAKARQELTRRGLGRRLK